MARTMKVQVSKVMTKELNYWNSDNPIRFAYVDDVYLSECPEDLLPNGNYKAICVSYPDEYYAVNQYITSDDLRKIFRRYHPADMKELAACVFNEYEI